MSWKLLSVKGENFKYFRNSKSIPIEGKNLLIYGENGSGKSSLYWLLYTLLQAKMKPYKADRIKYFNSGNTENLRNKYSMDAEEMKISATWGEYDNQNHLIQQKETSLSINDFEGAESNFLYLTAQASDFINYKSLTQLFDFRNSQRCEWFDVFLQDVFPFVNFRNKLKKYNLQSYVSNCSKDWWDYLVTFQNKVPRIANGNVDEASGEYQYVVDSLTSYSAELNTLISDIEFACNTLLWDKFKMKVGLRIELNNPSYNNNLPYHAGLRDAVISPPKINITAVVLNEDQSVRFNVDHPLTFFNEAKLTSISLALRLAIMQMHLNNYDGNESDYCKLLCIDDVLLGVDMSYRLQILDILLGDVTNGCQVLLFTHDNIFYNLIEQKINKNGLNKKWSKLEFYEAEDSTTETNLPVFYKKQTHRDKAMEHYKNNDLGAAGNYIRKAYEECLKNLLPRNLSLGINKSTGEVKTKDLNGLIEAWHKFSSICSFNDNSVTPNIDVYRQQIMNPLSHDDLDTPVYKREIKQSIEELDKLCKVKVKNLVDSKDVRDKIFTINVMSADGMTVIQAGFKVKGNIKCLEYNGIKCYSDTEVEMTNFKQKDYDAAGNETTTDLVLAVRPNTDNQHFLYDLYNHMKGLLPAIETLEKVVKNHNGRSLEFLAN